MPKTTKTTDCLLLAVSKTKPVGDIMAAYEAGQRHFGENYVDEFLEKVAQLKDTHSDIKWHFIGHLQTNKARYLARCPQLAIVETVDSVKLATELNKECGKIPERKSGAQGPLDVLV